MAATLPLWSPPTLRGGPDSTAVWNALVSHMGQPLPLRGQATAVIDLAEPPGPEAPCLHLRFAAGPDLVLRLISFPFAAMFEAELEVDDLPLLPEALRDALHRGLVAAFAAALPAHDLGAVDIVGTAPLGALPAGTGPMRWFHATIDGAMGATASLEVGIEPDALARIVGGGLSPRPVWPSLKSTLTREAAMTLGRLVMPWAQVLRLVPGTVVVLDAGVEAQARIRVRDTCFRFQPAEQGWTCTGAHRIDGAFADRVQAESIMDLAPTRPTSEPVSPTSDGASLADRLNVAVDIDLGTVSVPLAELETWQVGSIVALQPAMPREGVEVALRANGQLIGTGELVRVDDRLAVRLARMSLGT